MAMTPRLADNEAEALRRQAELESRSMQDVARQAIRDYVENHSRSARSTGFSTGRSPATPRHYADRRMIR